MNLSERLLQDPQSGDEMCVDLVRAVFSEDDMVSPKTESLLVGRTTSKLRIAKLLIDRNLLNEAEALLAGMDDEAYVAWAPFEWQILLCFRVLIRLGRTDRAFDLFSLVPLDHRIAQGNLVEIYLRIAEGFLNQNQLAQAGALINSLDPAHVKNKAHLARVYGKLGYFDQAEALIREAYAQDDRIQDGYSHLGWTKAKAGDWPGALELMTKDLSAGRNSPPWQVNLAQVYGNLGFFEKAAHVIAQAYAKDASVQDGYTRLGWIRVVSKYRDLNNAFRLMAKDWRNNRMSTQSKKHFALLMALLGRFDDACGFVERAYAEDLNLCDAYGFIGWGGFLLEHDKERFREWIERDCRLNRFSIQGRIFKANHLAASAMTNDAVHEAETVYRENPAITDIFARIGWHYFRSGDATTCCDLMRRDWMAGKMTPHWMMNYAAALSVAGKYREAQRLVKDRFSTNRSEERVVLGFPVFPDAVMSRVRFKALLSKKAGREAFMLSQTCKDKIV